jgi:phage antirepressor YoqD-like protein
MNTKYKTQQSNTFTNRQHHRAASKRLSDSSKAQVPVVSWENGPVVEPTVYSTDIALLTGKTHSQVMSEIGALLKQLELCPSDFFTASIDSTGFLVPSFQLRCDDPTALYSEPKIIKAIIKQYAYAQKERARHLQERLSEHAEKVEFYDLMNGSGDTFNLGIVAKTLDTGKTRLLRYLRKHGVLTAGGYKQNLPYQEHLDRGRFKVEWGFYEDSDGNRHPKPIPLATGKGLIWLKNFIEKHGRVGL